MADDKPIVVKNMDELIAFHDYLLERIDQRSYPGVDFSKLDIPPVVIEFDDGVEEHSGTITTSMMEVVISIQGQIYKLAEIEKGSALTKAEKSKLEIRARVEKGCTDLILDLAKVVVEEAKYMTVEQLTLVLSGITKVTLIIAVCSALKKGFKEVRKGLKDRTMRIRDQEKYASKERIAQFKLEEKRIEAEMQKNKDDTNLQLQLAEIEAQTVQEQKRIESITEPLNKAIELLGAGDEIERITYNSLSKVPEKVSVNQVQYTKEELKELGKNIKPVKPEPKEETVVDWFSVDVKDYRKSGVVNVQISNDKYELKNVPFEPDLFEADELEEIEHGKKIKLSIRCIVEDGKYRYKPGSSIMVKGVETDNPTDSTESSPEESE